MENNSSRQGPIINDNNTLVPNSSKRPRQNYEQVRQPIVLVKRTGVMISTSTNSDASSSSSATTTTSKTTTTATPRLHDVNNSSYNTISSSTSNQISDQTTTTRRSPTPPIHIEKLEIRPRKIRKTNSLQSKSSQQSQESTSLTSTSTSPPSPTPLLCQVPNVIDLTLDDSDNDVSPQPKASSSSSSQITSSLQKPSKKRLEKEPVLNKKMIDNSKKKKRSIAKKPFNFLGLDSSDTDSSNDDSDDQPLNETPAPKQHDSLTSIDNNNDSSSDNNDDDEDDDGNNDVNNKQKQKQSLYMAFSEEDELDEDDDDEDYRDKPMSSMLSNNTMDRERLLSLPSIDEEVNEDTYVDKRDGQMESLRMKSTGYKNTPDNNSELDQLIDGEEDEEQIQLEKDREKQSLQDLHDEDEYNEVEEKKNHKINTKKDDEEPLSELQIENNTDHNINENHPPALQEESNDVIAKKTNNDTITTTNTDSNTASIPKSREQNELDSYNGSDDENIDNYIIIDSPPITSKQSDPTNESMTTITSTSALTPLASSSPIEMERDIQSYNNSQKDPDSTFSSLPSSSLSTQSTIAEEGRDQHEERPGPSSNNDKGDHGHDNDDDDDDDDEEFYSASPQEQQSGVAASEDDENEEYVTAQGDQSSTMDGIETDTDYQRLSRHGLKTGYVYDVIMSFHAQLAEDDEPHPEDPRRIYSIYKCMLDNGLLNDCVRLPIRQATKNEILSIHDARYYNTLIKTKDMSREELEKEAERYNSIYLNAHSHESTLYSAGGVIEACSAVVTDKVRNAFAIVRPPGHHAEYDRAMGFCLLNNVAIATRYCKDHFPFVKRIMILDWDIHFGNGTQQLTCRDKDILYMSLHRYEGGTFYPQDNHGTASYCGRGNGKGSTVNIPWPNNGMTDGDYLYAFEQVVMPIAREFGPSLVIVSAGFDAAAGDHIGECYVTPAGYGQMTHMLKTLANGRIVLALEGGYNLNSIAKSAHACMSVLLGEAPEIPAILTPSPEAVDTIRKVKRIQSKYWDCLKY